MIFPFQLPRAVFPAIGLLLAATPVTFARQYDPEVGKPHVDFVLPRLEDRAPVKLSDYRGQKVLLIQFASW